MGDERSQGRRLIEIDVEEVSLVEKAANERKFLIVKEQKQEGSDMDPTAEEKKGQEGKPTEEKVEKKEGQPSGDSKPDTKPEDKAGQPGEGETKPEDKKPEDKAQYGGGGMDVLIPAVQSAISTLMTALSKVGYAYGKSVEKQNDQQPGKQPELIAETTINEQSFVTILDKIYKAIEGKPEQSKLDETLSQIQKDLQGLTQRIDAVEKPRQIQKGAEGDGGGAGDGEKKSLWSGVI